MEDDTFSFDEDLHQYRNAAGLIRPSVTEVLKHGGLFDYSRIDPQLLERKRIIGQRVHAWTAQHDISNREEDDVMDLEPEERGYAESYLRWRDAMGSQVEMVEIEKAMISEVGGFQLGGTPDRLMRVGARLTILDLKCVATFHPAWRLQLADYAMMRSKRPTCAAYDRAILQLTKTGRPIYKPIPREYDQQDSTAATAFVVAFTWRNIHRLI